MRRFIHSLSERGLIANSSQPISKIPPKTTVYTGFDPTAKSLHVGNLLTIISLIRLTQNNHRIIALIGGATGRIGDPSGKKSERPVLTHVQENCDCIHKQLDLIFDNADKLMGNVSLNVKIMNNDSWFSNMGLLEFIGDYGRFARVSVMLNRDSVKSRLSSPEGISFTEFTYQLLQAYDFYHLHEKEGCAVQLGGSDQWGNIIAGIDLIHKKKSQQKLENSDVFGITIPLVTTSSGEKFGKSAGNAIWLDKNMLSPFEFYQFFRKSPDSKIQEYLNFFTFLTLPEINQLMETHSKTPELQLAQKTLAEKVTLLVHGPEELKKVLDKCLFLYSTLPTTLTGNEIIDAFNDEVVKVPFNSVSGKPVGELYNVFGLTRSNLKKLIKSGGFYLNFIKIQKPDQLVNEEFIIDRNCLFSTIGGRKNFKIFELVK